MLHLLMEDFWDAWRWPTYQVNFNYLRSSEHEHITEYDHGSMRLQIDQSTHSLHMYVVFYICTWSFTNVRGRYTFLRFSEKCVDRCTHLNGVDVLDTCTHTYIYA